MKSKAEKKQELENLKQDLERARNVIVSSFSGLTVSQEYELRKQVRAAGGRYRVVKNTLAERAAKGTPAEPVLQGLRGPTAIAYTEADPVALAKAVTSYAKANPAFVFRAGVVEGRAVAMEEITQLATLPGRPELMAKLLFLVPAPARSLAAALGAVSRDLAQALDQAVKQNKFAE